MLEIHEIFRLLRLALSQRQIARATQASLGAVCQTIQRISVSDMTLSELLALG